MLSLLHWNHRKINSKCSEILFNQPIKDWVTNLSLYQNRKPKKEILSCAIQQMKLQCLTIFLDMSYILRHTSWKGNQGNQSWSLYTLIKIMFYIVFTFQTFLVLIAMRCRLRAWDFIYFSNLPCINRPAVYIKSLSTDFCIKPLRGIFNCRHTFKDLQQRNQIFLRQKYYN